MPSSRSTALLAVTSALGGAAAYALVQHLTQSKKKPDPESDYDRAHGIVWGAIGGALSAAQVYVGDKLDLYAVLRQACMEPGSSLTAVQLANLTGLHQRWLREWMAQQASMGILQLLPAESDCDDSDARLRYRLPRAMAEVLANPDSPEYDVSMVSVVPALVHRARTMLPEAFATGLGLPYNDVEISSGIDRQHRKEIRDVVIPKVIPGANNGAILEALQKGAKVADLGCGAGNLVLAMAEAFPNSSFYGYEVSQQALSVGATNLARSRKKNAALVDANEDPLGNHVDEYDLLLTFDVLHDAPNPAELIQQARAAIKPGGVWLLADIPAMDTLRQNIESSPKAAVELAFSTCLCMSCSLSTPDGAGLGTLGFTVPVAKKMLKEGGFTSVKVLLETPNTRWFEVM